MFYSHGQLEGGDKRGEENVQHWTKRLAPDIWA